MATLSFHAPPLVEKKIRHAAKRLGVPVSRFLKEAAEKEAIRETASFGAAVKKYAGIVRSGIGDLSTREGFGD